MWFKEKKERRVRIGVIFDRKDLNHAPGALNRNRSGEWPNLISGIQMVDSVKVELKEMNRIIGWRGTQAIDRLDKITDLISSFDSIIRSVDSRIGIIEGKVGIQKTDDVSGYADSVRGIQTTVRKKHAAKKKRKITVRRRKTERKKK